MPDRDRPELPVQHRLEALADLVKEDLGAAGLPVISGWGVMHTGVGAMVNIDLQAEEVMVVWQEHYVLRVVAYEEHARLKRDDRPAMDFGGEVSEAMRDAMARILTAAGYTVAEDDDDYAPYGLVVRERPSGPSWRDWHDQQGTRRQAIQARLLRRMTQPG